MWSPCPPPGTKIEAATHHASTAELPAQHRSPGLVDRMDLKYVLSEITTKDNPVAGS
jgi:hypothetical protein